MGDTEITSMIIAIIRVAAGPVYRSRITARGTTITAAPPSPCTARHSTNASTLPASAAPTEPIKNTTIPVRIGSLRPDWSAHGP
mgnify:CR=1 FL=1